MTPIQTRCFRATLGITRKSRNSNLSFTPSSSSSWNAWNSSSSTTMIRWYRGDSGEMTPRDQVKTHDDKVVQREQELFNIANPKYEQIQKRHERLPNLDDIPPASLPFDMDVSSTSSSSKEELELEVRKKRLVYRSKQRGWLEVDLLLGTWANENVSGLNMDELDQFEAFVNLETIDIYNVITLRSDVPEEMKRSDGSGVVERIQGWARSSPLGKAEPEMYSAVKKSNNLI